MYISIKRHGWFFKSWWCLLYFGHVQTRTVGKCWRQKTPFCLKLSTHAQWRQKTPFSLKLSTHAQKSVLSWNISVSRILDFTAKTLGWYEGSPLIQRFANPNMDSLILCVDIYWATPFKIHTPPLEDLDKCTTGKREFFNAPSFCVIFRSGLSQRE